MLFHSMQLHADPPSRVGQELFYTSQIRSDTQSVINTAKDDFCLVYYLTLKYISLDVRIKARFCQRTSTLLLKTVDFLCNLLLSESYLP